MLPNRIKITQRQRNNPNKVVEKALYLYYIRLICVICAMWDCHRKKYRPCDSVYKERETRPGLSIMSLRLILHSYLNPPNILNVKYRNNNKKKHNCRYVISVVNAQSLSVILIH